MHTLPVRQAHLVDPDGEIVLLLVSIHLHRRIHLERVHILRWILDVEDLLVAIERRGNKVRHRGIGAIKLQGNVIPLALQQFTRLPGVLPRVDHGVGNLPRPGVLSPRITLGQEIVLFAITRIEDVEFQSLGHWNIRDVQVEVENEVRRRRAPRQSLEPEVVGIRCGACTSKPELC